MLAARAKVLAATKANKIFFPEYRKRQQHRGDDQGRRHGRRWERAGRNRGPQVHKRTMP
jgi:hypothetical protein